jgi:hypothetical protein
MVDPRWDTSFKIELCNESIEDNALVVVAMLLSNLFLLVPVAYCLYVLSFLRLYRDIHNLIEEFDPGLLAYIHTNATAISKASTSVSISPAFNPTSPSYGSTFEHGYRIGNEEHARATRLVSQRYPSLSSSMIDSTIRWKGRDPSPILHFSLIFCAIAGTVSFIYHSCSSAGFCQFGDFVISHTMDRIYANFLISTSIMNLIERYSYQRVFGSGAVYLLATIVLEFTFPCNYIAAILNIIAGMWLLVFDLQVNKEGELDSLDRFYVRDLLIGAGFISAGIVLYMFDNYYSYTHPPWHALAALGITAVLTGTNRDTPFSPTFTQMLKIFPLLCYDGIFIVGYRFRQRTHVSRHVKSLTSYVNELMEDSPATYVSMPKT